MAADDDNTSSATRDPSPGATALPSPGNQQQTYETFQGSESGDPTRATSPDRKPPQNPQRPPTFMDGVQSIKRADFFNVHKIPCAREGFMTGIGAGAVIGMGRYVFGARVPKAANWAFGSFLIGSIIQWEFCQVQRSKEKAAVAKVVEVMDRKQAEKKARAEEAARRRREAEEKAKEEARKRWYKFW